MTFAQRSHAATPNRPERWSARCLFCDGTILRAWRPGTQNDLGLDVDGAPDLTASPNWPAIEAKTYWRHDAPGVVRFEP